VRAVLGTVALTAASAPEVRPAPVFGSGIHERITRNAFPFMTSGVLSVIVAGNLDEDQGVAADSGHRHAQNCQFRAGAAYANLRYGQVVAALREPSTSDPDRAARLFGHILHGAQDFYSHSNWIPTPPQGLGLRDRILDSGLGTWTQPVPYSTLFGDVVVIEGDPPAGVTVRLPADAAGRVAGAVPIVQDRRVGGNRRGVRGLMTSGAPRHPGDQLCPPVSAPCDIATPANVCLRHGDSRSSGTSSRNFDGAGRMNLDGDGGGDWFEARRHAVLQTRHEWCRLLHLSRDLDPSFVASGRLLGNWVGTDAGTNTPHIPGTPCQRGATRRHHVEITATPGSNAPSTVPFVVFRSDFTSSARAPTLARGATKTLGICANTNENVVAALIPARARGALIVVPVTGAAESRTFRDHRGAFTVTYTIRVTPNSC
jgi:hypothetical protein